MRTYHIILSSLILMALFISPAKGDEVLLGTVHSVDRDKGEVLLDVPESPWEELGSPSEERGDNTLLTVQIPPGDISPSLLPGSVIRVWGHFSGGNIRIFKANSIRTRYPGGQAVKKDPTGVRGRLYKNRGRKNMRSGRGQRGHNSGSRHR